MGTPTAEQAELLDELRKEWLGHGMSTLRFRDGWTVESC